MKQMAEEARPEAGENREDDRLRVELSGRNGVLRDLRQLNEILAKINEYQENVLQEIYEVMAKGKKRLETEFPDPEDAVKFEQEKMALIDMVQCLLVKLFKSSINEISKSSPEILRILPSIHKNPETATKEFAEAMLSCIGSKVEVGRQKRNLQAYLAMTLEVNAELAKQLDFHRRIENDPSQSIVPLPSVLSYRPSGSPGGRARRAGTPMAPTSSKFGPISVSKAHVRSKLSSSISKAPASKGFPSTNVGLWSADSMALTSEEFMLAGQLMMPSVEEGYSWNAADHYEEKLCAEPLWAESSMESNEQLPPAHLVPEELYREAEVDETSEFFAPFPEIEVESEYALGRFDSSSALPDDTMLRDPQYTDAVCMPILVSDIQKGEV